MYDSLSFVRRVSGLGTYLATFLTGTLVGHDLNGNGYYKSRRSMLGGHEKRWVLYKGEPEATKIPPLWFGWLHKMYDLPLPKGGAKSYQVSKRHKPNLTGTYAASLPRRHLLSLLALDEHTKPAGSSHSWRPPE